MSIMKKDNISVVSENSIKILSDILSDDVPSDEHILGNETYS